MPSTEVNYFVNQIPTIVANYQVPWRGWNHIDHLSSVDIDKYQNNYLLNLLAMYSVEWQISVDK